MWGRLLERRLWGKEGLGLKTQQGPPGQCHWRAAWRAGAAPRADAPRETWGSGQRAVSQHPSSARGLRCYCSQKAEGHQPAWLPLHLAGGE